MEYTDVQLSLLSVVQSIVDHRKLLSSLWGVGVMSTKRMCFPCGSAPEHGPLKRPQPVRTLKHQH